MTEEVSLNIELSSTYWDDRYPGARVYINDTLIFENLITGPTAISWSGSVNENNTITVEMYNKQDGDTVTDDAGKIINDVLLNINNISIDEIDLDNLLWTNSTYYPNHNDNQPTPESVKECVNLGWNGRWKLEFTAPVYLWLLENL